MKIIKKNRIEPKKSRGGHKKFIKLSENIIKKSEGMSIYDKINFIKEGISKTQLEEIKKQTGLDYETLAHILSVTKATLHNKKNNEKFNPTISERLFRLADIFAFGYDVFGEKERFNSWLKQPIRSTGWVPPIELLDTIYGMEEVKNIIGRIAWGIIS
jgi:putative toxin-antitoxin system antitoxin component (TIGR02293 family)